MYGALVNQNREVVKILLEYGCQTSGKGIDDNPIRKLLLGTVKVSSTLCIFISVLIAFSDTIIQEVSAEARRQRELEIERVRLANSRAQQELQAQRIRKEKLLQVNQLMNDRNFMALLKVLETMEVDQFKHEYISGEILSKVGKV
jgi:hypothetical protein